MQSRNDFLAKRLDDPTDELRRAWLQGISREQLLIDRSDLADFSFLILGDTGEGDESQFALVPPLLSQAPSTAFLFLCSDVLYPIGNVNDYLDKFYRPYSEYPGPIYAIPGNHDWYDGLEGFMRHICGREPPHAVRSKSRAFSRRWARERFWRRPSEFSQERWDAGQALRAQPGQQPPQPQPGPYFAMDTEHVRLVGIDSGITKHLDRDQAEWLVWISANSPKPKILLTGAPIYVQGKYDGMALEGSVGGFDSVDAIVRHPDHNYVCAIGGDIHNYQRYPVRVDGGQTIQYIVSGGGGAFMHATHTIPKIDPEELHGVTEDEFKCYPLRSDSLAAYSHLFDRKLPFKRRVLAIEPEEAAAYLAPRLRMEPTRAAASSIRRGTRIAALTTLLMPAEHGFHKLFSPFFRLGHAAAVQELSPARRASR